MEIKVTVAFEDKTLKVLEALTNVIAHGAVIVPTEGATPAIPKGEQAPATVAKKGKNAPKTTASPTTIETDETEDGKATAPTAEPKSPHTYEPEEVRAMLVEVKRKHGIDKCKELLRKYKAEGEVFAGLDAKYYDALAADVSELLGG